MCKCTKLPDPALKDWEPGPMVEHLPSMSKGLGLKGEEKTKRSWIEGNYVIYQKVVTKLGKY